MSDRARERDLVLAPNEYAFISDQTKGNINVYVGPYKTSLANTDQPVFFDTRTKSFKDCDLKEATRLFATAPEGWYLVLKNPSKDDSQPSTGTVNNLMQLQVGHKVNMPGPISFALWPGQMVRVVKGHHIRSNQYLLVRVYDEESAKANWSNTIIKTKSPNAEAEVLSEEDLPDLTMGKLLIIKGTEVSFYMPPTGIEVVRDERGKYIREAVTLERMEYCILLDEDGNKRYIEGPAVVFPKPTEAFVERNGSRKFKAIELSELSGIYIKVIAPYLENDRQYNVGEELFITGKEQMIYFPRPEHAIIKYGNREVHHAVAIPAGEGRYCLNRQTGQIALVQGPTMFLPDPRKQVIVRRVLDVKQVEQWFPGNEEALQYNMRLKEMLERSEDRYVPDSNVRNRADDKSKEEVREKYVGEAIERSTKYSPPRTITLNTKYDGAVTIGLWTGYAVMVVSKTGDRKVVVGPQTYLLGYDETLESMTLSTGTPKTDNRTFNTPYLRVLHNKVSDIVVAETSDLCPVHIRLSYRVNFEGDPEHWFNVKNYVKFLTDHMRSVLRNAIKRIGIEHFHAHAISIVRDTILGQSEEGQKRPGRRFEENGMRIYDVEVLDVQLGNKNIESLLTQAQHATVNQSLELAAEQRKLEFVRQNETIQQEILKTRAQTAQLQKTLRLEEIEQRLEVQLQDLQAKAKTQQTTLETKISEQSGLNSINEAELARQRATAELALALEEQKLNQRIQELEAQVDALSKKAQAVSPDLIAALQAFSDRALVEKVSESMAPLAILGGTSVADVIGNLLKGTGLEHLNGLASRSSGPEEE